MFERLYSNLLQCLEFGVTPLLRKFFYLNRELVVLESDLSSLGPRVDSLSELNMKFVEISKYNFEEIHPEYPFKNGRTKAVYHFRNGYRAFVILRGNEVIGDMWYATAINPKLSPFYQAARRLGIELGKEGVYLCDLSVRQKERQNGIAFYLMSLALHSLREKGFTKTYGYVWEGNRSASFLYTLFRFRELSRMKASRFLFFYRVKGQR